MNALMRNVSVVLVGIRNGGNIGSAARAMKNCGVDDLVLVDPPPLDVPEVRKLAWASFDIVQRARSYAALGEALGEYGFVVGATRRKGRGRRPVTDLRKALPRIAAATRRNKVAILFGREDKGLSNEELAFCQCAVSIRAVRAMASLNVARR
jgi:tRNA (cytidine32/uridine32-2'-O)-methyltransferase